MTKREYSGKPLDATYTSIGERDGKTIGGTSDDDKGEVKTEMSPKFLETLSEKQTSVIQSFLSDTQLQDPGVVDYGEFADRGEFDRHTVKNAFHKAFPESRGMGDITAGRRAVIHVLAFEGDQPPATALSAQYPFSVTLIRKCRKIYPDLIEGVKPVSKEDVDRRIAVYDSDWERDSNDDKEWPDDYTEEEQWFINTISDLPAIRPDELSNIMPEKYDAETYYQVIQRYSSTVKMQIMEKGTASDNSDVSPYMRKFINF